MSDILFIVIGVFVLGMGIFMIVSNLKIMKASKAAKEAFLKNHKDAEVVDVAKNRIWMYAFFTAACLGVAIMMLVLPTDGSAAARYSQSFVYLGIAVFCGSLVLEFITDSKVVKCPDGFMYESDYIRYKGINDIVVGSSLFRQSTLVETGGKETILPRTIAKWAEPEWEAWKENRRQQRKTRRSRGRQA